LHEALRTNGGPAAIHVADLRRILSDYEPLAWSSDAQCEFVAFAPPAQGHSPAVPQSQWEIPLTQ